MNIDTAPVVAVHISSMTQADTVGLRRWLLAKGIVQAVRAGYCGDGRHVGLYSAGDADRIRAWVEARAGWTAEDGAKTT